jgi:hypothetical protein
VDAPNKPLDFKKELKAYIDRLKSEHLFNVLPVYKILKKVTDHMMLMATEAGLCTGNLANSQH